jgi:hypothetical protein
MIKVTKNQATKLARGRPRLDGWRNLPHDLSNSLENINFFASEFGTSFPAERLSDLDLGDFRQRFTAAFLRYLMVSGEAPEIAIQAFGRSWRQFQRYLVGGDQKPKTDVVIALASLSGVPADWIMGVSRKPVSLVSDGLVVINRIDIWLDERDNGVLPPVEKGAIQLPASVLAGSRTSGREMLALSIKSPGKVEFLKNLDLVLVDTSREGCQILPQWKPFFVSRGTKLSVTWLSEPSPGILLASSAPDAAVERNAIDPSTLSVIGRIEWIGQKLR